MIILFLRYFWAVILHKICILIAGIRINRLLRSTSYQVSYKRLFLHDLSKFSSSEFWPYAEHFYGEKRNSDEFHRAWLHHVDHNDHHSEHFIKDYRLIFKRLWKNEPLENLMISEMPDDAILEMVADNLAATRSYEGFWPERKKWNWMTNSFNKFRLHPITKLKFTVFLCALGYTEVLPEEFDWTIIENANISNEEKIKLLQLKKLAHFNF